ncbi:uncharacterized protein BO72DRAFT_500898 [Aspergillus fijiensis CBS 313.89]|uniref:Uncharacterized protein n=1 Tax=Aspergillus fijiensis CBS 313.89 TaxID=1448319 RepID=A0A8G1RGN0_9EURO|nr:uncharacterized protein BO72DRAFT_500898 [Aspergillus fijiensis CBS 313.89]RAK72509.1 hypothetical protein BO72DRAFT_500898 [Aspergillus fijiensis CBS 313.89]
METRTLSTHKLSNTYYVIKAHGQHFKIYKDSSSRAAAYRVCLEQGCYYDADVKKTWDQAWNYDQQHAAETLGAEVKGGHTYRKYAYQQHGGEYLQYGGLTSQVEKALEAQSNHTGNNWCYYLGEHHRARVAQEKKDGYQRSYLIRDVGCVLQNGKIERLDGSIDD